MSLITKIENLQKKPESVRRRILFISMMIIMFAVIVIWISTFKIALKTEKDAQNNYAPLAVFKNLIKDSFNVITGDGNKK
jgi:hypothetical protein